MSRARGGLIALAVAPPLLLALAGVLHPHRLTDEVADTWIVLHLLLLPVWPLLALAPWLLARNESRPIRWGAGLLGYAYALGYTGLDLLAGVGAGALQASGNSDVKSPVYEQADRLAAWGTWAYLSMTLLAVVLVARRMSPRAAPVTAAWGAGAALVLGGAWSFRSSHIYWPDGVLTMLALAAGWALLLWVDHRRQPASTT